LGINERTQGEKICQYSSLTLKHYFIQKRRLRIGVDSERALIDEWMRTCSPEAIKVIIIRWSDYDGVRFVKKSNIHYHDKRKLRQLGFDDLIDMIILQVAIVLQDRTIVSNDCDFWNPKDERSPGNPRTPVATLCRNRWGIKILLPHELIRRLL